MSNRGRKKQDGNKPKRGFQALESRNVVMENHRRTSIRLEPSMWDALGEIAKLEGMTINALCSKIKARLDEQKRRDGGDPSADDPESREQKSTFTSAVRSLIVSYFFQAATDVGHLKARHGQGNPFVGTPFEETPPESDEGENSSGGVDGSSSSQPGTKTHSGIKSQSFNDARYEM